MRKRWFFYTLAGLAFGIVDWYILESLGVFSQSDMAIRLEDAPAILQLLVLALTIGVNLGVWFIALTASAVHEIRHSNSIWRAAFSGIVVWCSTIFGYYFYYTVLLTFWGLRHMEHMLIDNLQLPTFWDNWRPTFRHVILGQFLDWIGVALIGGGFGGGLVGWLAIRLRETPMRDRRRGISSLPTRFDTKI